MSAAAERSGGSADATGALAAAQLVPVAVLQGVHQSGVNSLAAAWLPSHSAGAAQQMAADAAAPAAAHGEPHANGTRSAADAAAAAAAAAACGLQTAVLVSGGDDQAVALTAVSVGAGPAAPQPLGAMADAPAAADPVSDNSAAPTAASAPSTHVQQHEAASYAAAPAAAADISASAPYRLPNAHASAVRGVCTDGDAVFSTGLDQRVRRWRIVAQFADRTIRSGSSDGSRGGDGSSVLGSEASGFRARGAVASPQAAAESTGYAVSRWQLVGQAAEVVQVLEPSCLAVAACGGGKHVVAVAGRGLQMLTSAGPDRTTDPNI